VSAYSDECETATDMLRIAHRLTDNREQEAAFYLASALVHAHLAVAEAIRESQSWALPPPRPSPVKTIQQ